MEDVKHQKKQKKRTNKAKLINHCFQKYPQSTSKVIGSKPKE